MLLNRDIEDLLPQLIDLIRQEENSSLNFLHLTANENVLSRLCESFLSTPLSHRYHIGTYDAHKNCGVASHGDLRFRGLPGVYKLEQIATSAAKKMFRSKYTEFRPLSGLHATLCVLATVTKPDDLIYSMPPGWGGHFATSALVSQMGRKLKYLPWDKKEFTIDMELFSKEVSKKSPVAILFDHNDPLFNLPIQEIRQQVSESILMIYDASHSQGLIAGGKFQSPLQEGCNILYGNTHKTFPGPQKGMIHFKDFEFGKKIAHTIGKSMVSSQHTHHAIALYIAVLEMLAYGQSYANQIVINARCLAQALTEYGFKLLKRKKIFTTSHMLLIEQTSAAACQQVCQKLFDCNISINTKFVYGKHVLRIGVQEVTRYGMKEEEMRHLALLIKRALLDKESTGKIRKEVIALRSSFHNIRYSFDDIFDL